MVLDPAKLFSDGEVGSKFEEACALIGEAVAVITADQLDDPTLASRLAERLTPRPPTLGAGIRYRIFESATVERDVLAREREGRAVGVELTIPFEGDADFFRLRAGAVPLTDVLATIRRRSLSIIAAGQRSAGAELVQQLDDQLETIRRELDEQRRRCVSLRDDLERAASESILARHRRLAVCDDVASELSRRGWKPVRSRA